jgi:hypothetical protein
MGESPSDQQNDEDPDVDDSEVTEDGEDDIWLLETSAIIKACQTWNGNQTNKLTSKATFLLTRSATFDLDVAN